MKHIFFDALIKAAAANTPMPKISTLNQWAKDGRSAKWTDYKAPAMKVGTNGVRKATQTTGLFSKLKSTLKDGVDTAKHLNSIR